MLEREARWMGEQLAARPDEELFPLLNIGAQTLRFRTKEQPWLERHLFAPLRARGGRVVHTDMQAAEGVDVVGDLTDPNFRAQLRREKFKSVICSNLLEHVPNPEEVARLVTDVVAPGGYLFLSGPYKYPYHPDPIDTMLRATPEELAALHPGTRIVKAATVSCGTYWQFLVAFLLRDPVRFSKNVAAGIGAAVLGLLKAKAPKEGAEGPPGGSGESWLFRELQAACVILQKL